MTITIVLGHKTARGYCGNDEYLISSYIADFASDMLQTLFAQSSKQLDCHSNTITENENTDLAKISKNYGMVMRIFSKPAFHQDCCPIISIR